MSANRGRCSVCHFEHDTAADVLACDAINGRVLTWPLDVRDPPAICALCGIEDVMSELLWHFKQMHGHDTITTGRLVRSIADTRDIGRVGNGL